METSTSENGRTTRDMVKVLQPSPMEISTSVSLRTARCTATGLTYLVQMPVISRETNTSGNSRTV